MFRDRDLLEPNCSESCDTRSELIEINSRLFDLFVVHL